MSALKKQWSVNYMHLHSYKKSLRSLLVAQLRGFAILKGSYTVNFGPATYEGYQIENVFGVIATCNLHFL